MARKGDKKGWNAKTNTGWLYDGTHWVQHRGGKATGRKEKHGFTTTAAKGLGIGSLYNKLTGKNNKLKVEKKESTNNQGPTKSQTKVKKKKSGLVTDHKDTGHTKLVKDSSGKVRRVKVSDKTTDKTLKDSDTRGKPVIVKGDKPKGSTVFTRHYRTGKELGVMTRSERRAYDKEASGRTFEGEVARYEKESGHGKPHLRETKYASAMLSKSKREKHDGPVSDEKKTGPTRLIKGVDGKVRRIPTKGPAPDLKINKDKDKKPKKPPVSNEKKTGPTKLVRGPDGKMRRVPV